MNFNLLQHDRTPPVDIRAHLVQSGDVGSGCRCIRVEADQKIPAFSPGQFFLLSFSGVLDPLLGRPFSPIKVGEDFADFVFRIVGKGTDILASLPLGSRLDLRGPCGNGFPLPEGRRLLLVAGTLGIAPFLEIPTRFGGALNVTSILGVPGRGWEDFSKWCREINPGIRLVSDDGTIGKCGTAVEEAMSVLRKEDEVWSCGPNPMLKNLQVIKSSGCGRILVSLEKRMACGIGGCLGCSVETRHGMKRACVEGPVFEWDDVLWNEEGVRHVR